jgi:hypothetical protein
MGLHAAVMALGVVLVVVAVGRGGRGCCGE